MSTKVELVEKFVAAGCDTETATMLAEGRDPRTDRELRGRIAAIEDRRLQAEVELGRSLGLTEAAAIEFALGRRPTTTTARVRELVEKAPDDAVDDKLATSFERLGLSEASARGAARGR
jgi:hypothetical protein